MSEPLIKDGVLHARLHKYVYELQAVVDDPDVILLATKKWCPTCGHHDGKGMCFKDVDNPTFRKRDGKFTANATCWIAKGTLRLVEREEAPNA